MTITAVYEFECPLSYPKLRGDSRPRLSGGAMLRNFRSQECRASLDWTAEARLSPRGPTGPTQATPQFTPIRVG
jgi:hypothetical protein